MRRPLAGRHAAVALVAAAALLAGCGSGGGARPARATSGPTIATTRRSAVFTVDCPFSHRAQDDPIVHPGMPGMSHPHDFFGNVTTDADSTARTLVGRGTTCEDKQDTAAYWAPGLLQDGRFVEPAVLRAYYRAAPGSDTATVRPPPIGLQLLAGDAHALPGHYTAVERAGWGCGLNPRRWGRRPPSNCTDASPLTVHLVFPDCWDGRDLASPDHRSHVAYSDRGVCPSSHPVAMLQVETEVQYPVTGSTVDLTLASGGWQTTHGDFLNAWVPSRLWDQTRLCIREMANCTIG